jgi:hypothetical protein
MLGRVNVHPLIEVVSGACFQVKLQLLVEFLVHIASAEQVRESVQPAHGNLLAMQV